MQRIESGISVTVSHLKRSPSAVIAEAGDQPVAVLNHNRVMAYMVPAAAYEAMLDRIDEIALLDIIRARAGEEPVAISIDDL